jgi:hypothetical protein
MAQWLVYATFNVRQGVEYFLVLHVSLGLHSFRVIWWIQGRVVTDLPSHGQLMGQLQE